MFFNIRHTIWVKLTFMIVIKCQSNVQHNVLFWILLFLKVEFYLFRCSFVLDVLDIDFSGIMPYFHNTSNTITDWRVSEAEPDI